MVMIQVNVFEVKAKLSEYLERAAQGERIIICRHNKPVAELRAIEEPRREPRPIGPLPGRPVFDIPASFFEPLSDEELDLWDGIGQSDPLSYPAVLPAGGVLKVSETREPAPAQPRRRTPRRKT